MATVEIDAEVLQQFFLPGLRVRIDSASWRSDPFGDMLALEVSGPDVPDCKRAQILMTQTPDETRPRLVMTAVITAIKERD